MKIRLKPKDNSSDNNMHNPGEYDKKNYEKSFFESSSDFQYENHKS